MPPIPQRLTSLVAASGLVFGALFVAATPAFAISLAVNTTSDTDPAAGPCSTGSTAVPPTLSLRDALCLADNLGGASTVTVPAGTYLLTHGEMQFGTQTGHTLTLFGAGAGSTIIDAQGGSRVLDLDPGLVGGVTTTISGVTIRNGTDNTFGGAGIIAGSGNASVGDSLTISNSVISGNTVATAATNNPGGGVQFVGGTLTITNSTISGNASQNSPGSGVAYQAQGVAASESFTMSGSTIANNTSTNTAGGSANGGALDLAGPTATVMSISGTTFTGNAGAGTAGPVRGGALRLQNGTLTVTASTFTGNSVTGTGSGGGAIEVTGGTATITGSRIVGNTAPAGGGLERSGGTANATRNWWGCNAGPGNPGCDSTSGTVTTTPRLVLSAPAVTATSVGNTTTVTADLAHDSAAAAVGSLPVFDGRPMGFGSVTPAGSSCAPTGVTLASGTATGSCSFTAGSTGGLGHVVVTVDNQAITVPVEVYAPPALTTSPADQTVAPGTPVSFSAAASGYPTPTVQWQRDAGAGFTDIGGATSTTLTFTAAAGDDGTLYRAVFTNTAGTATSAAATLSVREGPTITSADHATLVAGTSASFTVTTTGTPIPTITRTGALPSGMTFTDNGDGTATLAGTPATGSGGVYPLQFTAANGTAPDATQNFTLTVNEPPAITSVDHAVFPVGVASSVTVTTRGFPVPSLSESGALPAGLSFTDNGDGTATLAGTPTVGTSGTYPLTVTATNSVGHADQAFTLTVGAQPQSITFTSTPPANAVVGQTYAVAAIGGASGKPVTFSIAAGSTGVCSISGAVVHLDHAGSCVVRADQAGTAEYAAATATQTLPVGQAATTTALALHPTSITAIVAVVAPGAGSPTGTVTFSVDGSPVGTAPVSGGTATLAYAVPTGSTRAVSAVYGGDANFTGSSASTARTDPSITAVVTSPVAKTRYGWYRSAVTVSFRCTPASAPLAAPCPAAVTFTHSGAGQSVTRTVTATDGGADTVSVSGINIDLGKPSVSVSGVRNGAVYQGTAPTARCVGTDSLSGLLRCTLRKSAVGSRVYYSATAVDRAGNSRTVTGSYVVQRFFLQGATYRNGAFQVTEGQTYLLVALTTTNVAPRYYSAAPAGRTPGPAGPLLHAAGTQGGKYRWTLAVRIDRGLQRYAYWDLGVKTGSTMHLVRFHPSR